jgi:hypothetical protein
MPRIFKFTGGDFKSWRMTRQMEFFCPGSQYCVREMAKEYKQEVKSILKPKRLSCCPDSSLRPMPSWRRKNPSQEELLVPQGKATVCFNLNVVHQIVHNISSGKEFCLLLVHFIGQQCIEHTRLGASSWLAPRHMLLCIGSINGTLAGQPALTDQSPG